VTNLGTLETATAALLAISQDTQEGLRLVAVLLGLTSAFGGGVFFAVVAGYFRRG